VTVLGTLSILGNKVAISYYCITCPDVFIETKLSGFTLRGFKMVCLLLPLPRKNIQEAQLLLGWPTVLPYSRRLCKSCGAFMQIGAAVFS